jgi:SAM-dependent methyltransferase
MSLSSEEKKKIIERYDGWLAKHGISEQALGWTKGNQRLRFEILLSHWDVKGSDVLDFGCGFGDLYGFFQDRKIDARYEGIDINPRLVQEAQKKYPAGRFSVRDAFEDGLSRDYDFIFSSGVHNFKLADNWKFVAATFELFSRHARKGFALNFLADQTDFVQPDAYYADPSAVLKLARGYSRRVLLRCDYMPFEFTIFVDRRTAFDKNDPVFKEK